jgi:hypothetical protein
VSAEQGYFEASFNGHRLAVKSFRSNGGRDIVIQSPSRGNSHTLNDRGAAVRDTVCEIIFSKAPGQANHVERFLAFKADCSSGVPFLFVHPVDGSYLARVGPLPYFADGSDLSINCSATFIEDQAAENIAAISLSVPSVAGADSVLAASNGASLAATSAGLATLAAPKAAALADDWATRDELDPHQVFLDVAGSVAELDGEIRSLEAATDPYQWEYYKSLILVQHEIVKAGSAATQAVARMIEFVVDADQPLRVICANFYGAALAAEKAIEVGNINRIRTPACVPRGTVIKLPASGAGKQ